MTTTPESIGWICLHEAAHAVMNVFIGWPITNIVISPDEHPLGGSRMAGGVRLPAFFWGDGKVRRPTKVSDLRFAEQSIMVSLAGATMDYILRPSQPDTWGGAKDEEHAEQRAQDVFPDDPAARRALITVARTRTYSILRRPEVSRAVIRLASRLCPGGAEQFYGRPGGHLMPGGAATRIIRSAFRQNVGQNPITLPAR
jgi:hypothetical protein